MFNHSSKLKPATDKNRNVISVMKEVNLALSDVHKKIARKIDVSPYEHATNYVNRYISYTTVWNLKFNYNIESPEVALLQCLHLNYILNDQHPETFVQERESVQSMYSLFTQYKPFSDAQIEARKEKMFTYIAEQKKDTN